jgi:hypothetical protein
MVGAVGTPRFARNDRGGLLTGAKARRFYLRRGTGEEVAEKRRRGRKSSPQALKRGDIFSDLAARLKSGSSQNQRESEFFRSL